MMRKLVARRWSAMTRWLAWCEPSASTPVWSTEAAISARKRSVSSGEATVSITGAPLMHGTGLFNALSNLMIGGSITTMEGRHFSAEEFLDDVERYGINSTSIVGDAFAKPILRALDAEPDRWDISTLRVIVSSGVMWSKETKEGLLRHNPFPDQAPRYIRVDAYQYRFSTPAERKETGQWWQREQLGPFFPLPFFQRSEPP